MCKGIRCNCAVWCELVSSALFGLDYVHCVKTTWHAASARVSITFHVAPASVVVKSHIHVGNIYAINTHLTITLENSVSESWCRIIGVDEGGITEGNGEARLAGGRIHVLLENLGSHTALARSSKGVCQLATTLLVSQINSLNEFKTLVVAVTVISHDIIRSSNLQASARFRWGVNEACAIGSRRIEPCWGSAALALSVCNCAISNGEAVASSKFTLRNIVEVGFNDSISPCGIASWAVCIQIANYCLCKKSTNCTGWCGTQCGHINRRYTACAVSSSSFISA